MMQHHSPISNFAINKHFVVNMDDSCEINNYLKNQTLRIEKQSNQFQNLIFLQRAWQLNQVFYGLQQNNFSIETINKKLDDMDQFFSKIHTEFKKLESNELSQIKDEKQSTEEDSGSLVTQKKVGKLHYKDLFRQKMFGVKQYKYKLQVEGKIPQVLFKERNINLKINLLDFNDKKIQNENVISLHLKVFYSNGEEIGDTKKGENFMKGSLNCTMGHGKAIFDKVYPREVSRKLDKRKIVLVIYASGMGNTIRQCPSKIDPLQIQPMIIYGVKIITKQNKQLKPKRLEPESSDCQSEFTL